MPMDRTKYPDNWDDIAFFVKTRAGWKCVECGDQCRRPDFPLDAHKKILTTSHQNHRPMDCRLKNLKALCAACHLRYDAKHHAETRKRGLMKIKPTGKPPEKESNGATIDRENTKRINPLNNELEYHSPNCDFNAAKNEPPPVPGTENILELVLEDLQSRSDMGFKKYGTRLWSNNGRDSLMDAYQECLDLAMYLRQAIEERGKIEKK